MRHQAARLTSLLLICGLTACGSSDPAARAVHNAVEPAPPTAPAVPEQLRWRAGELEYGVALYWENNSADSDGTLRDKVIRSLDYAVKLGANAVSISFSFTMSSGTASRVELDDPLTPGPARLRVVLAEARAKGLRVTVRPLLHEKNLETGVWRGSIKPANRTKWFASYQQMLAGYAAVAQAERVHTFVLGTELNSLEQDRRWRQVTAAVRAVYSGELGYSANHDRLAGPPPAPGVVKSVDAYPPLALADDATVAQLAAGWNRWLDRRHKGPHPDLVLAEVAISAQSGAFRRPWSAVAKGALRPQTQIRWFEAACQVARQRALRGIYFWAVNIDFDPASAPPPGKPMEFAARPAEATVAKCLSARSGS